MSIADPNNNANSLRYKLIGGSCLLVASIHDIDAQMLQVSGISKDLWRPKYFVSDLLVLKLASSETFKKLNDTIMIS